MSSPLQQQPSIPVARSAPAPRSRRGGVRRWAAMVVGLAAGAGASSVQAQGEWAPHSGYAPHGAQYAGTPMDCPPAGGVSPALYAELLPQDRGFWYDDDSRFDITLHDSLRGAYLRLEYLNWDIEAPGANLLGAPVAGIPNPTEPFLVQAATGTLGVAEVLSTEGTDFSEINGIKGAFGIPLLYGSFEATVWGLEQAEHSIQDLAFLRNNADRDLDDDGDDDFLPQFVAISLLSDGAPSDRFLLFDRSFRANYKADFWGADANLYYGFKNPRQGLGLQPLFGARYMRYDESLNIRAEFDNSSDTLPGLGTLADPVETQIRSLALNNVYALQVGFRSDFRHRWFTVGAEPKIAFGANDYRAHVLTSNLRDFDDPDVDDGPFDVDDPPFDVDDPPPLVVPNPNPPFTTEVSRLLFSPTLDLGLFAKIHLTEWAHLRVGYSLIWTGNLVKANRSIYWNDRGLDNDPDVRARERAGSVLIQGLNVGGEIILP